MQYSTEKKWDNLDVRVYTGADGSFTLYEDEFDNYNYEKGDYSEIPFLWDEGAKTLTIGRRNGKYKGMQEKRVFNVSFINENGVAQTKTINYGGKEIKTAL